MPSPSVPADKRCSLTHPPGHPKEGQRCEAFRTEASPFCHIHAGNLSDMAAQKQRRQQARKDLVDDLENNHHSFRTPSDVATFTEKLINGVIGGQIKRDKASLLIPLVAMAWKMSKDPEVKGTSGPTLSSIELTEGNKRLKATFSDPAALDRFLLSDDVVAIQTLANMERGGNLSIEKKKRNDQALVTVKPLDPGESRIPAAELAQISRQTDIPLTTKQVHDLFGTKLADSEGKPVMKHTIDALGFGHVFEKGGDGLPEDAKPKYCTWMKFMEDSGKGFHYVRFNCTVCGEITKVPKPTICKGGSHAQP